MLQLMLHRSDVELRDYRLSALEAMTTGRQGVYVAGVGAERLYCMPFPRLPSTLGSQSLFNTKGSCARYKRAPTTLGH